MPSATLRMNCILSQLPLVTRQSLDEEETRAIDVIDTMLEPVLCYDSAVRSVVAGLAMEGRDDHHIPPVPQNSIHPSGMKVQVQ